MKRFHLLLALVAIAAALALSCGGGGEDVPTEPATGTATRSPDRPTPEPTRSEGSPIGQVDDADGDARVNGQRASQAQRLQANDRIQTGGSSSIDFTLTAAPRVECRTRANSELQLRPDAGTQIRWMSRNGLSYCSVDRGQSNALAAVFGFDPNIQIEVEGTLFGLSKATLRVVEGFVLLRTGQTTQRVGPNEEVTFSTSGQAAAKAAWDGLPDDEAAMVGDLQAQRPPASLTPSAAERRTSKLIQAIERQSAMLLLLDERAGPRDEEMAIAYFERLAAEWFGSAKVQIERTNRANASLMLDQRAFALFVGPLSAPTPTPSASRLTPTPARTPTAGTGTASTSPHDQSPFYIDAAGSVWVIEFPVDAGAKTAFRSFTRGVLATGDYYDMYAPLYGKAPPYDRLLELTR